MTQQNTIQIPKEFWIKSDAKYIFVSDFFVEDYVGGAELTLEAIYQACPEFQYKRMQKIHSSSLTEDMIAANKDKIWILVNFTGATKPILSAFVVNKCTYVIIEADYKYCKYRSEHHHSIVEQGNICKCNEDMQQGKWIEAFYKRAKRVFFMSESQMAQYIKLFPSMVNWSNLKCQYSTWLPSDIDYLFELRNERKEDNGKWAILLGPSWIKNQKGTEEYCVKNNIPYEVLPRLPYKDFLKELSKYKGLVFHPIGFDTCPRLVIEAKCIGLELDINSFVQMKDEAWFKEPDIDKFKQFLYDRPSSFWLNLKE